MSEIEPFSTIAGTSITWISPSARFPLVKIGRFHGTYPPNINEGTHLISVKGPTQFQVVPFVF